MTPVVAAAVAGGVVAAGGVVVGSLGLLAVSALILLVTDEAQR